MLFHIYRRSFLLSIVFLLSLSLLLASAVYFSFSAGSALPARVPVQARTHVLADCGIIIVDPPGIC